MKTLYFAVIYLTTFSITNSQDTTVVLMGNKSTDKFSERIELLDTTFTELTTANLTDISHGSAVWGDYDNDGDLDVLLSGYTSSGVTKIYRNNGDDSFTEQTSISLAQLYWGGTAWGDYDNDGDLDILLTGNDGSNRFSKIYRNNGDNSFTEQTSILLTGVYRSSVDWGDYDNDGDLDILLAGLTQETTNAVTKIYRNEGNNIFIEQSSISLPWSHNSSLAWGDYDNDGDLDFILTGNGPGVDGLLTSIYRNDGNNSFTEQTSISLVDVGDGSVDWGDYDSDGDLDILLTGWNHSGIFSIIYRNEGNNTFTEQTTIILTGVTGNRGKSAAWGDYDNDGDLDIILCGSNGSYYTAIFRNNGNNTFTEMTSINLLDVYDCSVAWGDYDNDGDLDIILTGSAAGSQRNTKVYKNNSSIANTIPSSPTNLSSMCDSTAVTLSWNKSTDIETLQDGLKYNIVLGTTPGELDIVSPMSDRSTGYRKLVDIGNTNHNNSWAIKDLAPGTYYWSVQAIDNNFAGSDFSTEQFFTLPTTTVTWSNQILIEDVGSAESSQSLIFGQHSDATDSIDASLGEYELPPSPPTGIFDARFNLPTNPLVSSFTDYRDSTKTEIIWDMTFQPSSAGYPMTFTWDSTSFPEGTFYLRDLVNGSFVFINMKEQSSYTLTEPAITSLNISYKGNCSLVSVNNEWNMISVPYFAEDMALSNLFPTSTSSAYGYDGGYVTEDTLVAGVGYWLKFGGSEEIQICGSTLGDTVGAKTGWNIIGAYEEDIPVSQITTTPPGIIATFFFGFDDGYHIADTLKSGQGYWVRVTEDGVINLNGGALAKDEGAQLAQIDKDWGKIKITDNEGKCIILYASEEEIESNLYELPPMPPTGIFDVRYGSGKMVEALSSEKIILISSDNYPITIKAEGLSITVRDRLNGARLNEELTSGEELRITNNKITSIEVTGRITSGIPISYELYQNYPNPFNPSTMIEFSLPEDVSNVKLSIYNVLGEKVAELVNATLQAGKYSYKWNAGNVATGMYIYELRTDKFISVKKMVLMK